MEQRTKQTETKNVKQEGYTAQRIISAIVGIIELLLAFRFVFKLLGANPDNGFVHGIYVVSQIFVGVFASIFSGATTEGDKSTSIFEPGTLIAMVVIALIAWIILKLILPRISNRVEKTEYIEKEDENNIDK